MDGIDAVLVDFSTTPMRIVAYAETPYPDDIRAALAVTHQPDPKLPLHRIKQLDVQIGRCFADAAIQLLTGAGINPAGVSAIGSHGQTILHSPETEPPYSWQIGDPATIAMRTGITTVADFRSLDVAAGGQGAPLVPGFHNELWRTVDEDRVVVNIGGIANVTLLPADPAAPVSAFDTGPGNCLLDEWISLHRATRYDRDGVWAAAGTVQADLLARMLADPYFRRVPPKSTGRDRFNVTWLKRLLDDARISPVDVQATLIDLTAKTIVDVANSFARHPCLLICGGGAFNSYLMKRLAWFAGKLNIQSTSEFGVEPDRVEACAFAWLAKLRLEGRVMKVDISGARKKAPLGGVYLAA